MRRKRSTEGSIRTGAHAAETSPQKGEAAKSYRVVSVSLYADQAEFVDKTVETLLKAGFAKANRSLVIQTALQHLLEDVRSKSPIETVTYVLEHQGRRPLTLASSRNRRALPERARRRSAQ